MAYQSMRADFYSAWSSRPSPSCSSALSLVDHRCLSSRTHQPWTVTRWQARGLPSRSAIVLMRLGGGDGDEVSAGDDAPETLFMKELRKRGLTPTADKKDSGSPGMETKSREKQSSSMSGDSSAKRNSASAPPTDQRKLSMALNSEGIDGLIPRAWELLKLGSSFVLLFWPLMLATIAAFAAAYVYLGASFVHGGNSSGGSGAPPYVEPYQLLGQDFVSASDLAPSSLPLTLVSHSSPISSCPLLST